VGRRWIIVTEKSSNQPIDPAAAQPSWLRRMGRWLHTPAPATNGPSSDAAPTDAESSLTAEREMVPPAPVAQPTSSVLHQDASAKRPAERPPARDGEAERTWFRTERVFRENGAWFIATREGINVGPYDNPDSARRDARKLIRLLAQKSVYGPQEQALTIRQFMRRPIFNDRSR